ncbi:hypothetical protein ACLI4Z_02595 [Natrialbaceae archaeon A-arb3/5]
MSHRGRLSRRGVLGATGSLCVLSMSASATASSSADECAAGRGRPRCSPSRDTADDTPAEIEQYAATVDRIVDGEHVVCLLEEDGTIVDQLVVPIDEFDDISEGDSLVARIEDGELHSYTIV